MGKLEEKIIVTTNITFFKIEKIDFVHLISVVESGGWLLYILYTLEIQVLFMIDYDISGEEN